MVDRRRAARDADAAVAEQRRGVQFAPPGDVPVIGKREHRRAIGFARPVEPIEYVAESGIGRVLRPGGRLVILEFTTPPNALVRWGYHLYFHQILPVIGRIVSGHPWAYRYLPESVKEFP